MRTSETLGDLVAAGSSAWLTCTADDLADALTASGDIGAAHLSAFCIAVQKSCRNENAGSDERTRQYQWIKDVADRFLGSTDSEVLARLASKLPTFDEKVDFAVSVANCESARSGLTFVFQHLTESLSSAVPASLPLATERDRWIKNWQSMISLQSQHRLSAKALAEILNDSPKWLLEGGLQTLGHLAIYDNFHNELAASFILSSNQDLPKAIATVLTGGHPPLRLKEQLAHVARASYTREGHIPRPDAPSAKSALRLIVAVENALTMSGNSSVRDQFRRLIESQQRHDDDLQELFRAYLDAVPRNHEEVFDYLTRFGTRPRGRALSDWGGPSITIGTSGSMRANSLHYHGPSTSELPSPDFDTQPVLKTIAVPSVIRLVQDQPHAEFALQYLSLFSHRPEFEKIASAIVNDSVCVERWKLAEGTLAVVVWHHLGRLAMASESFKQLLHQVQPELLRRIPSEYLASEHMRFLCQEFQDQARAMIEERLAATDDISELAELITAASEFGAEGRKLMDTAAAARFVLKDGAGVEQIGSWLDTLARLIIVAPEYADRIVQCLGPSKVELIVRTQSAFRVTQSSVFGCGSRLTVKALLIAYWATLDRDKATAALTDDVEQDFHLFFRSGFRGPIQLGGGASRVPPIAAARWLDLVSSLAPDQINVYVCSLLANAVVALRSSIEQSFQVIAPWIASWLENHQRIAPEQAWTIVEHRLVAAATQGDLKAAATFACLSLPCPPERLQRFRELAVDQLRLAADKTSKRICAIWATSGELATFWTLLGKDAPELQRRLSS